MDATVANITIDVLQRRLKEYPNTLEVNASIHFYINAMSDCYV